MALHAFNDVFHYLAVHSHLGGHVTLPIVTRGKRPHVRGDHHPATAVRHLAALMRPGRGRYRHT